jgi:uncharacterized protein (TIGR02246 family)
MSPHSLWDFAASYTAAWCSRDPARVASFFTENASLSINGDEPAVGRDAISEVARSFMEAFPDLEVVMDELELQARHPVYRWTLTGTHSDSGRHVRISGHEVWTMGDAGLIDASRGHFDADDYARQIEPASSDRPPG